MKVKGEDIDWFIDLSIEKGTIHKKLTEIVEPFLAWEDVWAMFSVLSREANSGMGRAAIKQWDVVRYCQLNPSVLDVFDIRELVSIVSELDSDVLEQISNDSKSETRKKK